MDLSAPAISMLSILRRMMAFTMSANTKVMIIATAKLKKLMCGLKYIISTFILFMTKACSAMPRPRPNTAPAPVRMRFSRKT